MEHNITIYIILSLLLIFAIVQSFRLSIPKKRLAKNRKKGKEGEDRAYKKLKKMGFKFESQYEFDASIIVDGNEKTFKIRPDVVGYKNGIKWVIDVKTGDSASINKSDTRRQLREYATYFPGYRVGLFNGDRDAMTLTEIEFGDVKSQTTEKRAIKIFYFLLGTVIGSYGFYLINRFFI
jgi:Holliday junction resolvase